MLKYQFSFFNTYAGSTRPLFEPKILLFFGLHCPEKIGRTLPEALILAAYKQSSATCIFP
jgi:hypothetical protein